MAKRNFFFSEKDQNKEYLLMLPHRCNFACAICGSYDKWERSFRPFEDVKKEVLKVKAQGHWNIAFGGSEPTLHPQLPEMVRFVISQGMRPVILTNGSRFASVDYARQYIGLNPLGIRLSFHAPYKELFDDLSGHPGSYEEALKAIKAIQDTLTVFPNSRISFLSITVTINHYNVRYLEDIVKQVDSLGVRVMQLGPVKLSANVYQRPDLLISPQEVVDYLRPALKYARSKKMIYYLCNIHPCLMEEQSPFIIPHPSMEMPGWIKFIFCKECIYNNTCRGVYKGFIMKKYAAELRQARDSGQEMMFKEHLTSEDLALLDKL